MHQSHDIGAQIKEVTGTVPAAQAAGAVNGAAIDRINYGSAVLFVTTGAETGSPSARSVTSKIQDSDDGSSGWNDVSGMSLAVSAINSSGRLKLNLAGVKRYIRVVSTAAFTAGTSPTLANQASVILGGATAIPAP